MTIQVVMKTSRARRGGSLSHTQSVALLCNDSLSAGERAVTLDCDSAVSAVSFRSLQVIDAPEILQVLGEIPHLANLLNGLYECRYRTLMEALD